MKGSISFDHSRQSHQKMENGLRLSSFSAFSMNTTLVLHEVARLDASYLNQMFQVDFPLSVNNILEVKALMYGMYL